jgi:hypothetical protein
MQEGLAGTMTTTRRALAMGAILVGLVAAASATATSHHKYVLKHPKREHCKAHYVKRVKRIKAHRKGRVVRVRKTFCVWVAPRKPGTPVQPTPPAPQPTPPTSQPTTTTLTIKPRGCEFFSYEFGASVQICEYILGVSITDGGIPVSSASSNLVFSNAKAPGESWTTPGAAEVGIFEDEECFGTCYSSIFRASLDALGEIRKTKIASVLEGGVWTVTAVYGGSAEYAASSSVSQTL